MSANRTYTTVISLQGAVDASVGRGFDTINNKLKELSSTSKLAGVALAGIGATVAAAGVTKKLVELGDNYNSVMADMQAKTGVTTAELQIMNDAINDIYVSGIGADLEDVAAAVSIAKQNTDLFGTSLQDISADALILRDTFDYDVAETIRTADALMDHFGITSQQAMNYIAEGAQNGLDYSGEFLESLTEFPVHFTKLGLDVNDMFQIFQAGADSGAYSMAIFTDAIKEFSILSIDGSDSTVAAYKQLGLNAEQTMSILASGGDAAEDTFTDVIRRLNNVNDAVKKDAIGVSLFGNKWEDLGAEAIGTLANINDEAYLTSDTLGEIANIKYNTLGDAITAIGRQLEVSFAPAGQIMADKLSANIPQITTKIAELTPYIEQFADKSADLFVSGIDKMTTAVQWLAEHGDIVKASLIGIGSALATLSVAKTVNTITSIVQSLPSLGAGFAALVSPVGLAAAVIGGVAGAGYLIYKNWDSISEYLNNVWQSIKSGASDMAASVKNVISVGFQSLVGIVMAPVNAIVAIWDFAKIKVTEFGNFINNTWSAITTGASNMVTGIQNKFSAGFAALSGIVKAPINGVIGLINAAISNLNSISVDIPDWVPAVGGNTYGISLPTIPMLAKGGFTDGISIAGEAGTEAVISFDKSVRQKNISIWEKAGQMLGADNTYTSFSVSMLTNGTNPMTNDIGQMLAALPDDEPIFPSDNSVNIGQILFSPKINVTGMMAQDNIAGDIIAQLEAQYPELIDILERWFDERRYFAYEN